MIVALLAPLDTEAAASLTAHMVQHVILLVVATPLLVMGAPLPALLWALPDGVRSSAMERWRKVLHSRADAIGRSGPEAPLHCRRW